MHTSFLDIILLHLELYFSNQQFKNWICDISNLKKMFQMLLFVTSELFISYGYFYIC